MTSDMKLPQTITWTDQGLSVLDQRQLPHSVINLPLETLEDAWHAIQTLAVRGAPAIGVTAAYALAQSMQSGPVNTDDFATQLRSNGDYLKSARPTAVNLAWAVDRVTQAYTQTNDATSLIEEAKRIHLEDIQICESIGQHGASLIQPDTGVLTHCNAGALATSGIGTATAPMYTQHAKNVPFSVFADETRPLYQGARLTAWELAHAGIDVTLICDNMAASLMAEGAIQIAVVGTDRVTANGDVVNKIGTLNVAILCEHFGIPFYVACPSSTFDSNTYQGTNVVIEQRDPLEVVKDHSLASQVRNPAFDVTPAHLVTGIITEHGVHLPAELNQLLSDLQ